MCYNTVQYVYYSMSCQNYILNGSTCDMEFTAAGAPRPAPPPPWIHTRFAFATAVALKCVRVRRTISRGCRSRGLDVIIALDRPSTRRLAQLMILRRLLQEQASECRKGLEKARASKAATPSHGRSQRRDTGRGPVGRCMCTGVLGGVQMGNLNRNAFANELTRQDELGDHLRLLVRAVIMSHRCAAGSGNSRIDCTA